jgi:hypothetical protein
MTSSRDSIEVIEGMASPGDGNSAPLGSTEYARHFSKDPFSGGIIMAVFSGKRLFYRRDTYFQAKLTTAERILYEKQDVYLPSYELNGGCVLLLHILLSRLFKHDKLKCPLSWSIRDTL